MELIKQHISPCLHSFANEISSTFEANFKEIQNYLSTELVGLIRYLDNLYNEAFITSNDSIAVLHIHIEEEFNDLQKLLIAEFLCIKTFTHYHSTDNNTNEANLALIELIAAIETKLNVAEMRCPEGARGRNGGNRIWKNWVEERKNNRSLLEFYKSLNERSSLKPKLIINTKINFCSSVSQIFEFKPYCVLLNSKNKSYNLLNATQTLNEIDAFNNEIEGKVLVQITINEIGEVSNPTIVEGLGYGCDEEAIRLIKEGPEWKAAIKNGAPVSQTVKVKITFK